MTFSIERSSIVHNLSVASRFPLFAVSAIHRLFVTDRSLQASQQGTKTQGVTVFLQTIHSKKANRALKRKELLKRKKREE